MHVLSIVFLHFHAILAYAVAFNPYDSKLSLQSPSVFVTRLNTSHCYWEISRQSRLDAVQPWAPLGGISQRSNVNHASKRSPTPAGGLDTRPTPAPTGDPSPNTTVHITDENDFSLIAPRKPQELISDAEEDGVSYCTAGASSTTCLHQFPDGFITAAAVRRSDDGSWIQVTGCINPSKSLMSTTDGGGQFDVRFPNGAQCSYGGYGASFIELIEPSAKRFCLRCCASENDQMNCNSHQDRAGCPTAIPGVYDFPDVGVSCM